MCPAQSLGPELDGTPESLGRLNPIEDGGQFLKFRHDLACEEFHALFGVGNGHTGIAEDSRKPIHIGTVLDLKYFVENLFG